MYPTNIELLEQTKEAFANVKGSVVVAMQKLYAVFESKCWESVASSWGEYVESELGISQGFASKLLTVNRTYLLDGEISPEKLAGIDYERLYLARNLDGSIEEKLAKAQTLNRSELRAEQEEKAPCVHEIKPCCVHCWSVDPK